MYSIPTNLADNGVTCHHTSEVVKLKIRQRQKFMSHNKTAYLYGNLTHRKTSFECLRYMHLSSRQAKTYSRMASKSCSPSGFEHSSS